MLTDIKLKNLADNIIKVKISKAKITIITSHNLDKLKKICKKFIFYKKEKLYK
jgi:ABC-type polysaccharide/polyol phosphate transport system ATPase subunit